ncbi:hypothetical protein ES703_94878 [subsurface metagenome]
MAGAGLCAACRPVGQPGAAQDPFGKYQPGGLYGPGMKHLLGDKLEEPLGVQKPEDLFEPGVGKLFLQHHFQGLDLIALRTVQMQPVRERPFRVGFALRDILYCILFRPGHPFLKHSPNPVPWKPSAG